MHTALAQLAGAADPLVPVVWSVQEWASQDMSLIQVGALQKPSESTQTRRAMCPAVHLDTRLGVVPMKRGKYGCSEGCCALVCVAWTLG